MVAHALPVIGPTSVSELQGRPLYSAAMAIPIETVAYRSSSFERLLYERLLPEFCNDPTRRHPLAAFRPASIRVSNRDAVDFVRAWDAGLVEHQGRGMYRAPRSAASEQFFWHGPKRDEGRTLTLWLEPIITVAALGRLHLDFGWPRELLGMQSRDYAFDILAWDAAAAREHIAGEVKKTETEVNQLISFMQEFGASGNPTMDASSLKGKALNAYRKVQALSARRVPLFWAVGPNGMNRLFAVTYDAGGCPTLDERDTSLLRFSAKPTRMVDKVGCRD